MTYMTHRIGIAAIILFVPVLGTAQTDWPMANHDAAGTRFSPLKQINTKNVSHLKLAWEFDTLVEDPAPPPQPPPPAEVHPGDPAPATPRPAARRPRRRMLMVDGVVYMSTGYSRLVALNAETGQKIWEFESVHPPALRGISYWPGAKGFPPRIIYGTGDGFLVALNAKTGKLVPGFGAEGILNLKPGVVSEKVPNARLGVSSPPAIYKDLVIVGSNTGEAPARGAKGDVRAFDVHTGKLVWTVHTVPQPGEPNHEAWQGDEWVDRSGVNSWGFTTVDEKRGLLFVPIGTPNTDFWGGDRKGSNLYGSSLLAIDAATGKIKWYFQTTHHDNWDYDLTAAPILCTVKRDGKEIPAVAQITKQAYLFIFDRLTGTPLYEVKETPVANDNPTPGDENWPTQPIPVKPPALARTSFAPEEIATVTPEHEKYCRALLAREGGALTGGPFAHYGPKLSVIFPSWTGGTNWGGGSYDPTLGYVFVDTKTRTHRPPTWASTSGTAPSSGPASSRLGAKWSP